jgi:hypothetical protein
MSTTKNRLVGLSNFQLPEQLSMLANNGMVKLNLNSLRTINPVLANNSIPFSLVRGNSAQECIYSRECSADVGVGRVGLWLGMDSGLNTINTKRISAVSYLVVVRALACFPPILIVARNSINPRYGSFPEARSFLGGIPGLILYSYSNPRTNSWQSDRVGNLDIEELIFAKEKVA